MAREYDAEMGTLGSALARWRSYRQMHRVLIVVFVLFTILVLDRYRVALGGTFAVSDPSARTPEQIEAVDDGSAEMDESMLNAGNSTLGFHKIFYINMRARHDREDAMALQTYISGLETTDFPAVEADLIDPVGMPPTHRPSILKVGEKGCWRAHANIWSEMVRKKLPPVLIIESDATWDVNIRPIMARMNKEFVTFMRNINSTAVHDPSWGSKNNKHPLATGRNVKRDPEPLRYAVEHPNGTVVRPPVANIPFRADDPWLSEHWDLFSLGQCFEHPQDHHIHHKYPDPRVPSGKDFWGTSLGHERVLRRSGGITCTTAYAISHTGAAKLLMRGAVDLDNPVDLLIRRLTLSRDLVAYSVMPPVIAQFEFLNGIGMGERGAQSDINGGKHKDTPADANMPGWDDVKRSGSVWTTKAHHRDVGFEKMALDVAWEQILGEAQLEKSWYDPQAGD